jgi:cyd operon protein YbgT
MWYFTWILGLGLAVGFGVLNGLWHEFHLFDEGDAGLSEAEPAVEPGDTPPA